MHPGLATQALCGNPSKREQLDEAHRRPGGPAAKDFGRTVCRHCPIRTECLTEALTTRAPGFWAGTSPRARTLMRKRQRKEGTT